MPVKSRTPMPPVLLASLLRAPHVSRATCESAATAIEALTRKVQQQAILNARLIDMLEEGQSCD